MRMDAEVKRVFNLPKALSTTEDHRNGTFWEVRVVRGSATKMAALAAVQVLVCSPTGGAVVLLWKDGSNRDREVCSGENSGGCDNWGSGSCGTAARTLCPTFLKTAVDADGESDK